MLFANQRGEPRGELIKDILLNSHHITLNTNIPTYLPLNQTQQPNSPDITTASADVHDCPSWETIHSLTTDHLPLHSVYITKPKQLVLTLLKQY